VRGQLIRIVLGNDGIAGPAILADIDAPRVEAENKTSYQLPTMDSRRSAMIVLTMILVFNALGIVFMTCITMSRHHHYIIT